MEDKYYVPELSEINFGFDFEFEVYNLNDNHFFEVEEGWHKSTMHYKVIGNIYTIMKLILDKQIRVKYLDAEDLIELGFEKLEGQENSFENEIARVTFLGNEQFVNIHAVDHWNGEEHLVYQGQCKNKSKLKVILKDLGI